MKANTTVLCRDQEACDQDICDQDVSDHDVSDQDVSDRVISYQDVIEGTFVTVVTSMFLALKL